MRIDEFQKLIESVYYKKDSARGVAGTYMWFAEEVGELSRALRRGDRKNLEEEFADCFAWLSTLASLSGISLEQAVRKYVHGCPRCAKIPCSCSEPAVG